MFKFTLHEDGHSEYVILYGNIGNWIQQRIPILKLTLSLPRVINVKFLLQLHQKYCTTQYEELGFS